MVVLKSAIALAAAVSLTVPLAAPDSEDFTQVRGMTTIGWNPETATTHGFQLSLGEDGAITSTYVGDGADGAASTTAVRSWEASEAAARNPSYVYGDCGESWLFIEQEGLGLQFVTGYSLYEKEAISHIWDVVTNHGSELEYWDLSGVPLEMTNWTWQGARSFSTSTLGTYEAEVLYGVSFNSDGSICVSGNPGDAWGR